MKLFVLAWTLAAGLRHQQPLSGRRGRVVQAAWRLYDVVVSVDSDPGAQASPSEVSKALETACVKRIKRVLRLRSSPSVRVVEVVRKSLDTRKKSGARARWVYVADIEVKEVFREIPGVLERARLKEARVVGNDRLSAHSGSAVVVGYGPAGMFCALELASAGVHVTLIERGSAVEKRGADIGRLVNRRLLNPDSNFAFGEGGAGTWSDGKLTTRVGRNGADVRAVLATLVAHGAPDAIMTAGAPHLGTDALVKILRSVRTRLIELGVDLRFETKLVGFKVDHRTCNGVYCQSTDGPVTLLRADAVVVATGHSSDDVYFALRDAGAELRSKPLAVGFRVEHPQALINRITYGNLSCRVRTGKRRTDEANGSSPRGDNDRSLLPVASYRLAIDDIGDRAAYSFCMCPGGQIVPASTQRDLMVVNGMSYRRRDSLFANAGLVVSVAADDPVLEPYATEHGPLKTLAFQRDLERRAARLGGGDFVCPVHRLLDFVEDRPPRDLGRTDLASSYRLGVVSADCRYILPQSITRALAVAAGDHFEKQMPGFATSPHALLHSVETRTSSPVQVSRCSSTLQSTAIVNLFPCGEGAGYAGGIVSAACDGIKVARAVVTSLRGQIERPLTSWASQVELRHTS